LKGAIVFLATFLLFLAITLGYQALPPGRQIYDAIVGAESSYPVGGISVTSLAVGVFNGVIYGFIIYVVFWILTSYVFKREPTVKVKVQPT
jgi:hypothetical protein